MAVKSSGELLCDEAEHGHSETQIAPDVYDLDDHSSVVGYSVPGADLPLCIADTTWKEDRLEGRRARDSTTFPQDTHSSTHAGEPAAREEEKDKAETIGGGGGEAMDIVAPGQVQVDNMEVDSKNDSKTVVGTSRVGQEEAMESTTLSPTPTNQSQSVVQAVSSSQNHRVESQSLSRSPRPHSQRDSQEDVTDSDFLHGDASDSQEEQEPSMKMLRLESLSSTPPSSFLTPRTDGGLSQPQRGMWSTTEQSVLDKNGGDDRELRERGKVDGDNEIPSFFGDAMEFEQILLSTCWVKARGQGSHTVGNRDLPTRESCLGEAEPENGGETLVHTRLEKEAVSHEDGASRRSEGSKGHEAGGGDRETVQEPITNTLEVDVVGMDSQEGVGMPSSHLEVTCTGASSIKEMGVHTHPSGISSPYIEKGTDRCRCSRTQHMRSSNNVGESMQLGYSLDSMCAMSCIPSCYCVCECVCVCVCVRVCPLGLNIAV